MRVRRQGLFFAFPLRDLDWMVCAVPFAGRSVPDARRSFFCCNRPYSDRSRSHPHATSAGGLSLYSARLVTSRGNNRYASE